MDTINQFLRSPLFVLGGITFSALTLLLLAAVGLTTWLVARIIDRLLHRILEKRHGEEATNLIGVSAQLAIWALGVIVGSALLGITLPQLAAAARFEMFTVGSQPITPRAIVILILVLFATGYVARLTRKLGDYRVFTRVDPGPRYTMIRLIQYAIWVVGVLIGLNIIHINLTALAVVAGALGLGIGFGLQQVVGNFVAGLVLLFEQPIRVGDFVSSQSVEGRIEEIRFRSTIIQTNDNISVIVPNSELTSRELTNWSHNDSVVRVHCPVGVAYGSDVDLVTKTLLEVAQQDHEALKDPESKVWFSGFGDSSLNFVLLVWTAHPKGHRFLKSRLNYAIDRAFRAAGIQIPFPQRDLHVRSAAALLPFSPRSEDGGDTD